MSASSYPIARTCFVCAAPSTDRCGRCLTRAYCSKEHQAQDWRAGHKRECLSPADVLRSRMASAASSTPPESFSPTYTLPPEAPLTIADLRSIHAGALSAAALTHTLRRMRLHPELEGRGGVFTLDARHGALLDDAAPAAERASAELTASYSGAHVDARVLFAPALVGVRWVMRIVDASANTLTTLDPCFGKLPPPPSAAPLERFLASERARLGKPARPAAYQHILPSATVPLTADPDNSGVFVFAYVSFLMLHQRLPKLNDWGTELDSNSAQALRVELFGGVEPAQRERLRQLTNP